MNLQLNSHPSPTTKAKARVGILLLALTLLSAALLSTTQARYYSYSEEIQTVTEHVIYEDIQQTEKSFKFFSATIGQRYFTGSEHLVFKVMAEGYDSDPDIFISKQNRYPMGSSSAEWHCEREGSETCVVHNGEFALGDTFFFGVKCLRECRYRLRLWLTNVQDLSESERTQMKFERDSTQIFKYYIPVDVGSYKTQSVELMVVPEDDYSHLEVFLSMDRNFYLIEEKPATLILKNGMGIKFGKNDYQWCVNCFIYIIANIFDDQRYYITSQSIQYNDPLMKKVSYFSLINPFNQDCFEYFVLDSKKDTRFDIYSYTGQFDSFILARDIPDSPATSKATLRTSHATEQSIILRPEDRFQMGYTTGSFYLCMYAWTPFSGYISVVEAEYNRMFDIYDSRVLTSNIDAESYFYSRYANSKLANPGQLLINLYGQDLTDSEVPPQVFYQLCNSSNPNDCTLNEEQAQSLEGFSEVGEQIGVGERQGLIDHDPANCRDPNSCVYIFFFQNALSRGVVINARVQGVFFNPGDVNLDRTYKNIVAHGKFVTYELNPQGNPDLQPFLSQLKINLETMQGDADLFVSLSNPNPSIDDCDYSSRRSTPVDQVVIEDLGGLEVFQKPIFISVFGEQRSQFFLSFEYETKATYIAKLSQASVISDSLPIYEKFEDEYAEGFYKFRPWWSMSENRTVVFLADVLINKVFFYAEFERYPEHFKTSMHDLNDTIAIYGTDAHYQLGGSYYLRLRPDFAVFDLLADRPYVFVMNAFSMAPTSTLEASYGFETLNLGEEVIGFVNNTHYQDYRYFQFDMEATYNITLQRVPGMGVPKFLVKVIDSDSLRPGREDSYHFASADSEIYNETVQTLILDQEMRISRFPYCAQFLHSLQPDGKQNCLVAISVFCSSEDQCGYFLNIEQQGVNASIEHPANASTEFTPTPPRPILLDRYTNGVVEYGKINYHFIPFDRESQDMLILLNKTDIYGTGLNGDSKILALIQQNTSQTENDQASYRNWVYPTNSYYGVQSQTNRASSPEVVEIGQETINYYCNSTVQGCGVIIGAAGISEGLTSTYRIKGFLGQDKIKVNEPRKITVTEQRTGRAQYDYFWFVVNDTVANSSASFEYQVSVATNKVGVNPNLFVSLVDGRNPDDSDFDLSSTMIGADSVRILSDDPIWDLKGWNHSDAVLVVVGVQMEGPGEYDLLLTTPESMRPQTSDLMRIDIGQSLEITLGSSEPYYKLFKLYNWGHREIRLSITPQRGNATLMASYVGQKSFLTNIYTAVPENLNNSFYFAETEGGNTDEVQLASDVCFTCWYFIAVKVTDPATTSYRLSVIRGDDQSGRFKEMRIANTREVFLVAGFQEKLKFLFDSTDSFTLSAQIATGDITIYVGLDPATVGPDDFVWKVQSADGVAALSVKTTDSSFHMATYYFVSIWSSGDSDAWFSITLNQQRTAQFVPNDHDYTFGLSHPEFNRDLLFQKHQFQSEQEQVKFHLIQVPGADASSGSLEPRYFRTTIRVEALTEHFYPTLYLKKLELDERPTELTSLSYPNIVYHDMVLGANPFEQLHQTHFDFSFTNVSNKEHTYYTVALFENNWGLTDYRKSEYQIMVNVELIDKCEAIGCGESSPVGSNGQATSEGDSVVVLSDGSILKWIQTDTDFQDYIEYRQSQDGTTPANSTEPSIQASATALLQA